MHGDFWNVNGECPVNLDALEDDHIIVGYNWIRAQSIDLDGLWLAGDSGATNHLSLRFLYGSGALEVRKGTGGGGTLLGTSSGGLFADGVMHHIEVDAILHDTTGQCKVYVDDVLVIDVTGADTKNGGTEIVFDRVTWKSGANALHPRLDDVYIITADGVAPNTRVGPCRVARGLPTGNGANSGLLGSDGNSTDNYLLADENPPNTSDYLGSATEGLKDSYPMTDLPSTAFQVYGVRGHLYAAKSDAGSKFVRPVIRSGGTDFAGASKALAETYTTYSESWGVDPNT
ncbi:MAG: hypothetical protein M3537_05640, partial [Chloroflexota bacterium]|nr:hypothetical protein [Chloroflexota bacterium]